MAASLDSGNRVYDTMQTDSVAHQLARGAVRKMPGRDLEVFWVLPCLAREDACIKPEVNGQCVVLQQLRGKLRAVCFP